MISFISVFSSFLMPTSIALFLLIVKDKFYSTETMFLLFSYKDKVIKHKIEQIRLCAIF